MKKKLKILISPLNWGLGHAGRITPVIHAFLQAECEVILAADGNAYAFLAKEFPDVPIIQLKDINIRYSKKLPFILKLSQQFPALFRQIKKEHKLLQQIVEEHHIDIIISDNRYGLFHPETYNIIVSHQIYLKLPHTLSFLQTMVHWKLRKMLLKFDELWIPDMEGKDNLSGALSHPQSHPNTKYIGYLSRLEPVKAMIQFDYMVILSGPEPQRTLLEEKILNGLKNRPEKVILVRGLPENRNTIDITNQNVLIFNHLSAKALSQYICASRFIICRSGYSSLMDLSILSKPAILIPTPQQTEQEYLAKYLESPSFKTICQKEFTLEKAIKLSKSLQQPRVYSSTSSIQEMVKQLLKKASK